MEDYIHATKVGRHSVVEVAQSYLKGYASTWWRTVRQEEGNNHGYTWEFLKERVESEFIPKNSDYISRCKLRDLVNTMNDNLCQYVRAYSELMLEIRHMHELDCVCHFVMRLPTWVKCKLEENWLASLSKAIMKVESFSDVGWGEKSRFKNDNTLRPHFEKSVKMKPTLPKWGLGSPLGLSKLQSSIARVKTPCLGAFFISLESYQSVDVENGLA
jgi:hypothetical protein